MQRGRPAADPLSVLRHLTDRDRWLLDLLDEHQVLTTDQLTQLAFPSLDVAQRRLLKLTQLTVLDRFRWHTPLGSQSWRYTLGLIGETLIAAGRGADPPRAGEHRERLTRLAANPRLPHLLGLNGLFTALAAHARTHPGTELEAWWSEQHCQARCAPFAHPDGYGRWTDGTRTVSFFVEYDTGSEPLTTVAAKLPGYADLATAGGPDLPVLFWTTTLRRETNLQRALAEAGSPVTVATTCTEFAQALGTSPAGPVWLTAPGHTRHTLADLGTPPRQPAPESAAAARTAGTIGLTGEPNHW
jgi:hypothetical protein